MGMYVEVGTGDELVDSDVLKLSFVSDIFCSRLGLLLLLSNNVCKINKIKGGLPQNLQTTHTQPLLEAPMLHIL